MQALPAKLPCKQDSELDKREAEPRQQCVPRQEPGNERFYGGDQRDVSNKSGFLERISKAFHGHLSILRILQTVDGRAFVDTSFDVQFAIKSKIELTRS